MAPNAYDNNNNIKQNHTDKFYYNNTASQSKAIHLQAGYADMVFCSCDLDLDRMTLAYVPA